MIKRFMTAVAGLLTVVAQLLEHPLGRVAHHLDRTRLGNGAPRGTDHQQARYSRHETLDHRR